MKGARRVLMLLFALMAAGVGSCGDDDKVPGVFSYGAAEWRRDPGSVADVGYHVQPDIGWVDRAGTCAHIPRAVRVTVNELEATPVGWRADCDFDALFDAGPFTTPDPVTVRVVDGDRLIGEATFEQPFWGMQAGLVSPPGGQVHPGDQVVASIPPGKGPPALSYATWYWLGTAPSVPPFYTTSLAELSADNATFTATVPDMNGLTGPVALTFSHGTEEILSAVTCTGFVGCALAARYTLGPIAITVLAP